MGYIEVSGLEASSQAAQAVHQCLALTGLDVSNALEGCLRLVDSFSRQKNSRFMVLLF